MKNKTSLNKGGCFCGSIRYQFKESRGSCLCYCQNCRRISGAQSLAWVGVKKTELEIVKGEPAIHIAPNGTKWSFCSFCGTTLFWDRKEYESLTVTTGSLDNPEEFPPEEIGNEEDRLSWDHLYEPPIKN